MSQTSTTPAAAVRATASSYTLPTAIASSQSPSQQPQQQQQLPQPQVRRPPVVLRTKSPQPKVSSTTQRSATTAVPVTNAAPNNNRSPPYALAAGSPTSDGERLFPVGAPPQTTSQQKQTNGLGNQQRRLQSFPSSRAAPLNVPSSSSPQRSRSTSPRLDDGNPLSAVGTMQVSAGTSRTVSPASSSLAQQRNYHKSSSPLDLGGDSQTPCTSDLDRSPSPDPQDVLVQELRTQLSDARQEIAELRRLLAEKEFALSTTQNLFSQFALQLTNNTQQQQQERGSRSRSPPNRSASVPDVDHATAAQLYHRRAMERYHDRRIALTPLYPPPGTLPTVTNTLFSTMTQQPPRATPYQDQRERNPLNRLQFLPLSEGLQPRAAIGPNNKKTTAMGTPPSTMASSLHPKRALRKRKSSSNSTSQLSVTLPPPQHDDESDDLSDLVFDEPKTQANWITPAMPLSSSPPTSGRAMFGTSPSASSPLRSAQYKSTHKSQGTRANSGSVQPLDDSSDRLAATNWLELSEDESTGQQFVSLLRPAPSSVPPAKVVNLDVGYHTIRSNNEQQQKRETEFNTFWPYRQA